MGLTEEQSEQLKKWGVSLKSIEPKPTEPKPVKKLPTNTLPFPIQKTKIKPLQIFIGFVIGMILAFLIMTYYPQITTGGNELYLEGIAYGMEYMIASITEEAIQCNQIPVNYSSYNYTLVAVECLEGIQNG